MPKLPKELEAALLSLYGNYEKYYEAWQRAAEEAGEGALLTPPVFIVVCNNTNVSKLVFDWIAGWEQTIGEGDEAKTVGRPRQPEALQQRLVRPVDRPPQHHPHRLRAARVGRAAQPRVQEGRGARDRGVQGRVPPALPRARPRGDHRRGPAARGHEHGRQARAPRRADQVRGQRLDAHRGLGRQHGDARARHPRLLDAAALRAGRGPGAAPHHLRDRRGRHVPGRVRRGLRRAVLVHPGGAGDQHAGAAQEGDARAGAARARRPRAHLPAAHRLPLRARRREAARRVRRGAGMSLSTAEVPTKVEIDPLIGRDGDPHARPAQGAPRPGGRLPARQARLREVLLR